MPPSVEHEFRNAVQAHQEKRIDDADALCLHILEQAPNHAACLHLKGVIEQGRGNLAEAENWMRRGLALNDQFPEMHYMFAHLLAAQSKYPLAEQAFRRTIALRPDHAPAFFGLGNMLKMRGDIAEAARAYAQAIAIKPDYIDALNSMGVLLCQHKKYDEAQSCFESAITAATARGMELPAALSNLAVVFFETDRWVDAEDCCRRALAAAPDQIGALINLGNALKAQKKWGEAAHAYGRALEIDPKRAEARNNIGLVSMEGLGEVGLAIGHFRILLQQDPHNFLALTHMGVAHSHCGSFAEALMYYEKALAIQSDHHEARNNLGNTLRALGRLDEAIVAYRRVIAAQPDNAEAYHNMALALLHAGRFAEGWGAFEYRWQTPQLAEGRVIQAQPQWRGEQGAGRVLLVHAEQGFGDTLQFCRYIPMAEARGFRIILEVQPELARLTQSLAGVERVIARGQDLPAFDLHCPMLSLPLALNAQFETIPALIPYLTADEKGVGIWRDHLENGDHRKKVGLVWAGNPRHFSVDLAAVDRRRSIAPEKLAPLMRIKDIRFFSLQKDKPPPALNIENWMPECRDFADTAAVIAQLDLVISVDTAVAHLAGAMGKPVWLLNRYDTCWRWFASRDDSPWYPSMRLFRQTTPGDWDSVIQRVVQELAVLPTSRP